MGTELKIELERAFRSKGMTLSLFIGYSIGILHFIQQVFPWRNDVLSFFDGTQMTSPLSLYNMWIGMDDTNTWLVIYLTIFPILATLPFATTYFDDIKSGYIKNVCTRTKKTSYMVGKYISVFVAGGIVVVLPMLLNLFLTATVMPAINPAMNGLFKLCGAALYANIFFTYPFLYICIYMMIYFIYGGVFATISLAVSNIVKYKFIVALSPFVVFYGLGIISSILRFILTMEVTPRRLLTMTQYRSISGTAFWGEPLFIGCIAFVIYWLGGKRNDIF